VEHHERPSASEPFAERSKGQQAQSSAGGCQEHAQHLVGLELLLVLLPHRLPLRFPGRRGQAGPLFVGGPGTPQHQLLAVNVNAPKRGQPDYGKRKP
jgi:hypothetical protein